MTKLKFQNVTGMPDILPHDRRFHDVIEKACFKLALYYGYERIETPILEYSELFEKGTGISTDIVQKQMYTFTTRGGDKLTLRPEITPSIVRAYIQHGMNSWTQPVKMSSIGPVFRHERPQAGRFREFRQFEIDSIGGGNAVSDAQIIFIFYEILRNVGLRDLSININSIGCSKCKPNYKKALRDYYRGRERSLCKDCRKRKKENILRLLDCKDEKCERIKIAAPEIIDYLCSECNSHFKNVLEALDSLELPYVLSPYLVRGLDYYTKTVFEIFPVAISNDTDAAGGNKEGRMTALVAGGRFDDLVEMLGGDEVPAVGGALGMERVIAQLKAKGMKTPEPKEAKVFLVHLGDLARKKSMKVLEEFRAAGIYMREALGRSSIRTQMAIADKMGVSYVLILGHQEVAEGNIIIRDMKSGSQESVPMSKAINEVKKRLKKITK